MKYIITKTNQKNSFQSFEFEKPILIPDPKVSEENKLDKKKVGVKNRLFNRTRFKPTATSKSRFLRRTRHNNKAAFSNYQDPELELNDS